MTVISLTVLMGLMKEAVKGGEDRQRERNHDGGDDSGHLGNATQGGGGGNVRAYRALVLTTLRRVVASY